MKTSFTTLACPDWTIDRVIDAAVESKYDAIDLRGHSRQDLTVNAVTASTA